MTDGKLVLTPLGEFVARHSVFRSVRWWRDVWKDANRLADEDGDLDLFFAEMLGGIAEMRDRFYELQPGGESPE